jgi:hypothetical protein
MSEEHRIILLIFNNFANLFLCLNASIDFILYCFLSEKFARTCKQIICRQCTQSNIIHGQNPRLLSIDRTSGIVGNTPNNYHQQQLAANTTNKYYVRLYRTSSMKNSRNKKWKKKFVRSITTNTKSDNHIFYHKILTKNKPKLQHTKPSNIPMQIISNTVLDYIDENNEVNETTETK